VQTETRQAGQLTTGGLSTGGVPSFDGGLETEVGSSASAALEGSWGTLGDDKDCGGEFGVGASVIACLINRGGMKAEQVDTGQYKRSEVDHSSNFAL
jgi:hypothetical protein